MERFRAALQHYSGVRVWDHWAPGGADGAEVAGRRPLLFWSANAARERHRVGGEVGPTDPVILVRLDGTAWPSSQRLPARVARDIDATALGEWCRWQHGRVIWRAVTEIVGELRGVRPLEPALELEVAPDGQLVEKGGYRYFAHAAVMGSGYVEALEVPDSKGNFHRKVPAVPAEDGGYAFRFSIPEHEDGGTWAAFLSFGLGDSGWRTVDLRRYRELRFDARADSRGAPLSVGFDDGDVVRSAPSGHNQTTLRRFEVGDMWRNGRPFVVELDTLDWGADAAYGNGGPVDRGAVLQLGVGNSDQPWPRGPRWIEMRNIVLL